MNVKDFVTDIGKCPSHLYRLHCLQETSVTSHKNWRSVSIFGRTIRTNCPRRSHHFSVDSNATDYVHHSFHLEIKGFCNGFKLVSSILYRMIDVAWMWLVLNSWTTSTLHVVIYFSPLLFIIIMNHNHLMNRELTPSISTLSWVSRE